MTSTEPTPEPHDNDALDPVEMALSESHALRRLAMLEQMAEIGMALMQGLQRRVARQLEAEEAGEETPGSVLSANETAQNAALTFSRLTRAMRLTFALDARLRDELRVREYGPAAGDDDAAVDADNDPNWAYASNRPEQVALRRAMYRNAVNAVMTEAIETTASGSSEVERLRIGLYENLFENEAYDDIEDAGLKDVLVRVCTDLQIDPDIVSHWLSQSWASATIFSRPIRPPGVPDRPFHPPYDTNRFGSGPQRRRPDG
jgi:hypothetical protein